MKNKVYEKDILDNFRELIEYVLERYPKNVAYKYKKDPSAKEPEYIEKTYEQTCNDIKALSTKLLNMGLKGKRVILIGNNSYEWCISYLAVTCGDMVIVPLDKSLPENEIETLIKRSKAEVAIFDSKYCETIKKIKDNTNLNTFICMQDTKEKDILNINKLVNDGKELLENGDKKYSEIVLNNNEASILLFTSGTTNNPKAVMLSQHNICSNFCAYASHFKILPTDTLLSFLPIHHTFESSITILYGFYSGATIAFCDGLKHIQKNLKEYGVTIFVAVPLVMETMYKKILKTIKDNGKEETIKKAMNISNTLLKFKIDARKKIFKQVLAAFGGKLRVVLYGAASMDKDTIIGLTSFGIKLVQGYGLTESSPVIAAEGEGKNQTKPGSVGYPLDNVQVKIDNPDADGVGEILAKGPNIMLGYCDDEEQTKEALQDGWLRTGDFGYIDEDGFIFVTGRKKDIIVLRNGKNVYPQEIEFLINKLAYVKESLVYQREKNAQDTMLCAKIVYDESLIEEQFGKLTKEEYKNKIWEDIKDINKNLPTFKHIKSISITTEELAKTTTQKVKRYEELKKIKE